MFKFRELAHTENEAGVPATLRAVAEPKETKKRAFWDPELRASKMLALIRQNPNQPITLVQLAVAAEYANSSAADRLIKNLIRDERVRRRKTKKGFVYSVIRPVDSRSNGPVTSHIEPSLIQPKPTPQLANPAPSIPQAEETESFHPKDALYLAKVQADMWDFVVSRNPTAQLAGERVLVLRDFVHYLKEKSNDRREQSPSSSNN